MIEIKKVNTSMLLRSQKETSTYPNEIAGQLHHHTDCILRGDRAGQIRGVWALWAVRLRTRLVGLQLPHHWLQLYGLNWL